MNLNTPTRPEHLAAEIASCSRKDYYATGLYYYCKNFIIPQFYFIEILLYNDNISKIIHKTWRKY